MSGGALELALRNVYPVQSMFFPHTGWTCTTTLQFGTSPVNALMDEVALSLLLDLEVSEQARENLHHAVILDQVEGFSEP